MDKTHPNYVLPAERQSHIIKWRKLTQKQDKSKYDKVETVVNVKLSKQPRFDHKRLWFMHKPKTILEN